MAPLAGADVCTSAAEGGRGVEGSGEESEGKWTTNESSARRASVVDDQDGWGNVDDDRSERSGGVSTREKRVDIEQGGRGRQDGHETEGGRDGEVSSSVRPVREGLGARHPAICRSSVSSSNRDGFVWVRHLPIPSCLICHK